MIRRRILFADPAPLPPGAPAYQDAYAERELEAAKRRAEQRMAAFDANPQELREIETEVWDPAQAVMLWCRALQARGIDPYAMDEKPKPRRRKKPTARKKKGTE